MTDTTDIQEKLKQLLYTLQEKLGPDADPEMLEEIQMMRAADLIKKHLTAITKDRTIVLTGDTGHLSIDYIINKSFGKIDEPKKYDFQDDDCNEKEFLRSLLYCVPSYIMRGDVTHDELLAALEGREWLELPGGREHRCYDCAQPMKVAFKGNEVRITAEKPCEHNRKFVIEVDFPTGEVVYDDWPARFSEATNAGFLIAPADSDESINYIKGQRQSTDHYAKQQIVHHSVGNTCPQFYVNSATNQIQIGGGTYNEETDEYEVTDGLESVGSFCTDLWWVTMLDRKFYDMMVAGLPKERDTKYYEKQLHTTKIAPGRYRFTCHARTDDDEGVFVVGERIGDASDFVPKFDISAERTVLTLEEAAWREIHTWSHKPVDKVDNIDRYKLRILDRVFNGIGYGIDSKGDFLNKFTKKNGEEIQIGLSEDKPMDTFKPSANFKKQYSFVWECNKEIDFLPDEWLRGALSYYEQCKTYFENGAEGYDYAYPNKNQKQEDDFRAIIERLGTEKPEAEWHAYVSKTYGGYNTPFTGDFDDWRRRSWEDAKVHILAFIEETIGVLKEELDKRS